MVIENKLRPKPQIGWNIAVGGQASGTTGIPRSQETKDKLSAANKGRVFSPESIAKRVKTVTGRKQSEATKAKIAASRTGKVHSAETRAKMSGSRKTILKGNNTHDYS